MVFGLAKVAPGVEGDDSPPSSSARSNDRITATALLSRTPESVTGSKRGKKEEAWGPHLGSSAGVLERVSQMRHASMMQQVWSQNQRMPGGGGGPGIINGALASYFTVPHPKPGKGVVFSPKGDLLLRFGFGPEIRLTRTTNGAHCATLRTTPGGIRFADWSPDGRFVVAASDDMRIFVYDVEAALAGAARSVLRSDIDVGEEPVAYCLMSPSGDTVLSCDDDGQLETWSIQREALLQRYSTGHSSVMASFSADGRTIVSCADFECGLVLLDAQSADVVATETFDLLAEGRNKTGYAIAPNGKWVAVYILEQTWGPNLAIYDVVRRSASTHKVCDGAVLNVEFSAEGAEFITSGRDNLIHVYDTATMDPVSSLEGHECDVLFCRVSGDRAYAISGDSDGDVFVWDVGTSEPILRLQAHTAPVVSCDMSTDGRRAYTLDAEGHAYLWYLDMQGLFDVMLQNSHQLSCMETTADARHVAVGYEDGTLRLWALGMYISQVWLHVRHESPVECLALSPSRGLIVSGDRGGVLLFTLLISGQVLSSIQAHKETAVTSLCYCGDGTRLLSSGRDGTLCLWDDSVTVSISCADDAIPEGDERAESGGVGGEARLSVADHPPLATMEDPIDGLRGIGVALINSTGTVVAAACLGGHVALWDGQSGVLTAVLTLADVEVTALAFSECGRHLVAGAADGSVTLIDAECGQVERGLPGNASPVTRVFFQGGSGRGMELHELSVVSVCSRQALTWALADARRPSSVADFISDGNNFFRNSTLDGRVFVAHQGLSMYDPLIRAAVYDMRTYENHPGNSSLFRSGTSLLTAGVHHRQLVMYTPPDKTVSLLVNESGGVRCLDFSPNGKLLVSGNLRGELAVWDMVHLQLIKTWMAHKRSAITCVKFSHDSSQVYSCGEDTKVVLWHWTTASQAGLLQGHHSAVVSVDMSLNGLYMVSGDKDGIVLIWDAVTHECMQAIAAHTGPVLCCSISPDGRHVISSGTDEHICVIDVESGEEVFDLDDALDGQALTVKFSFDGSRVQLGGEKGDILIWDVARNCLLYDIKAHVGRVYDCSWSGDSRRLLSVGTDGRARLWDAAAGSEMCSANFERGFGKIESGGFVKCDLSADGNLMAGCTAKGHLFAWDIGQELRREPNGQMLYQWLASMPVHTAKQVYTDLLAHFPLLYNAQDSRGWTVLMHAAANSNPEIVKVIVGTISRGAASLGLMASPLQRLADGGFTGAAPGLVLTPPQARSAGGVKLSMPSGARNATSSVATAPRGASNVSGVTKRVGSAPLLTYSAAGSATGLLLGGGGGGLAAGRGAGGAGSSRFSSVVEGKSGAGGRAFSPPGSGLSPPSSGLSSTGLLGSGEGGAGGSSSNGGLKAAGRSFFRSPQVSPGIVGGSGRSRQPAPDGGLGGLGATFSCTAGSGGGARGGSTGGGLGNWGGGSGRGSGTARVGGAFGRPAGTGGGAFGLGTGGGAGGGAGFGSFRGGGSAGGARRAEEPNAIRIAISASSGDCVHHLLNAVLDQKVTPGSYHCVTRVLADVAEQYPTMCEAFLSGLPLRVLGEMEVPSRIATQGTLVHAATSYTSYKELWQMKLKLDAPVADGEKCPMVVMEAVMVQLPFPAEIGSDGLLHKLGESNLPVKTFGSATVQAIILWKWRKFSQRAIIIKTAVYLAYLFLFTAYAVLLSDDLGPPQEVSIAATDGSGNITMTVGVDFAGLASYPNGWAEIVLSFVVFLFGAYFMALEGVQLVKLGAREYFSSFWNFMDLTAYACSLIIPPCVLLRYQMNDVGFVYALVACEALLLWGKSLFYGLAVDGLGTFIYMIIQIIKGLKYFYVLLGMLYISFSVALVNLFREPPSHASASIFRRFPGYENFQGAILSLYLSQMQNQDARAAYSTMWSHLAIAVMCLYCFLANVIMLNLIITLMSDLYANIKKEQQLVFLRNRADLILEVESTMTAKHMVRFRNIPPYLHLLRPVNLEDKREEANAGAVAESSPPIGPRPTGDGSDSLPELAPGVDRELRPGRELSHFAGASMLSRHDYRPPRMSGFGGGGRGGFGGGGFGGGFGGSNSGVRRVSMPGAGARSVRGVSLAGSMGAQSGGADSRGGRPESPPAAAPASGASSGRVLVSVMSASALPGALASARGGGGGGLPPRRASVAMMLNRLPSSSMINWDGPGGGAAAAATARRQSGGDFGGGGPRRTSIPGGFGIAGGGGGGGASVNLERVLGEMQASMAQQNRELVGLRRTVEALARSAVGATAAAATAAAAAATSVTSRAPAPNGAHDRQSIGVDGGVHGVALARAAAATYHDDHSHSHSRSRGGSFESGTSDAHVGLTPWAARHAEEQAEANADAGSEAHPPGGTRGVARLPSRSGSGSPRGSVGGSAVVAAAASTSTSREGVRRGGGGAAESVPPDARRHSPFANAPDAAGAEADEALASPATAAASLEGAPSIGHSKGHVVFKEDFQD
ncbi:hypothetical protein FOA52_000469 [Chlamydomonas sp. UWO 241]|nr:hypothetical protein FOA52_000469 [Chlamydomonas sp. UWO 241]